MEDIINVDCFSDKTIPHRVIAIYVKEPIALLPEELVDLSGWGTRIFITAGYLGSSLAFSPWTWVIQKPDTTDWSVLLSILPHLKAPRLIAIDSNIPLPPRFIQTLATKGLDALDCTVFLYRSLLSAEQPVFAHICLLPPDMGIFRSRIIQIAQALWTKAVGNGQAESVAKVYQELADKGMWLAVQLVPETVGIFQRSMPSLFWFQSGGNDDDMTVISRFRNISKGLSGLFTALGTG